MFGTKTKYDEKQRVDVKPKKSDKKVLTKGCGIDIITYVVARTAGKTRLRDSAILENDTVIKCKSDRDRKMEIERTVRF